MMEKLVFYLDYPFVRYALVVGIFIALCASLFGVSLVLRRLSFIGNSLSYVAFSAMAVSAVLRLTGNMLLVLAVTVFVAVVLQRRKSAMKDAQLAMLSAFSLALGYLVMNVFPLGPNISSDVCTTLFGSTSILTLSKTDVFISIGLSLVAVFIYVLFYHQLFALTFDGDFAQAVGMSVKAYEMFIAVMIAVIVVLAMHLVGSLLISALVVFPAMSAMKISKSYRSVSLWSAVLAIGCAFFGMIFSILAGTPVGATIVVINGLVYAISRIKGIKAKKGILLLCLVLLCACGKEEAPKGTSEVAKVLETRTEADRTIELGKYSERTSESESSPKTKRKGYSDKAYDTIFGEVDGDLTTMNRDMVFVTVFQMMQNPESYIGYRVRIKGMYYPSDNGENVNHYCIILDAMGCCAQGMEFQWNEGDDSFPKEPLKESDPIIVQGIWEAYQRPGDCFTAYRLGDTKIMLLEKEEGLNRIQSNE